jgi:hypothetical protein
MYIVIDKETKKVLWKNPAPLSQKLTPDQVWTEFKQDSMFIATCERDLPQHWKVDDNFNIVEATLEDKVNSGVIKLEYAKTELKQQYSNMSHLIRHSIIPDYKLINCSLGIYDKEYTKKIKKTIQAFRKEFYRIEKEISIAKTVDDLKNITPNFPTTLLE